MRVEFWFDFNNESYETLKAFEMAYKDFYHKDKVDVFFRSLPKVEPNYIFHDCYQYGRRKKQGIKYLLEIFEIYQSNQNLLTSVDRLGKFFIDTNELKADLLNQNCRKFVLNQLEHAELQKIAETPTLAFTHGLRLSGKVTKEDILDTFIKMYEKDTGIKYCIEEDCER